MNDSWETDNDTEEDIDGPLNEFSGFKKRFLLEKPPDRREPERLLEPTRAYSAPDNILHDIQYPENTYGQSPGEDAMPIPYAEAAKLFQKIKIWTQTRVFDANERVEKAAKTIEEAVNKIQNTRPASYAQAARIRSTRAA